MSGNGHVLIGKGKSHAPLKLWIRQRLARRSTSAARIAPPHWSVGSSSGKTSNAAAQFASAGSRLNRAKRRALSRLLCRPPRGAENHARSLNYAAHADVRFRPVADGQAKSSFLMDEPVRPSPNVVAI